MRFNTLRSIWCFFLDVFTCLCHCFLALFYWFLVFDLLHTLIELPIESTTRNLSVVIKGIRWRELDVNSGARQPDTPSTFNQIVINDATFVVSFKSFKTEPKALWFLQSLDCVLQSFYRYVFLRVILCDTFIEKVSPRLSMY